MGNKKAQGAAIKCCGAKVERARERIGLHACNLMQWNDDLFWWLWLTKFLTYFIDLPSTPTHKMNLKAGVGVVRVIDLSN